MVRDHRTDILATGEHELDDDALILDQIVVEVNLPAILGNKFHVGQVTPADELARRDVLEVVLLVLGRLIRTEQPGCAGHGGSCSCSRQQISPCHLCHDLCSFLLASGPPSGSLRYIAFGDLLTTGRSPTPTFFMFSLAAWLGSLVVVDHAGTHLE